MSARSRSSSKTRDGDILTFRERSHENVDTAGIDSEIVTDTSTTRTECSDRVRLVNVQVKLCKETRGQFQFSLLDHRGEETSAAGSSPCTFA